MNITKVFSGEYATYYLTDSNTIYQLQWDNTKHAYEVEPLASLPTTITDGSGGLDSGAFVDTSGNVWTIGLNEHGQKGDGTLNANATSFQILKDVKGNPFTGISAVRAWYYSYIALKTDGTVWTWGQDFLNLTGSTTNNNLSPTQISVPAGVQITKIVEQAPLLMLDNKGNVYQYAVGSKVATQVTLPGAATDIASSGQNVLVAIVGGYPYAWSKYTSVWNIPTTPTSMKTQWNMPAPIASIVGNDNTLHYIDTNGDLWGVGDNAQGEVGNGQELNYSVATAPNALYTWSWGLFQKMVATPVKIISGAKFKQVCTHSSYVFYVYAQDTYGNWYSWGRNKGGLLGNGIVLDNTLAATYPNLVDQPTPQVVTPLTTTFASVPSLAAGEAIYAANQNATTIIPPPPIGPIVISAGADQQVTLPTNTATLTGTASQSNGTIASVAWTQTSGPSSVIGTPSTLITTVKLTTAGTYIFQLTATDGTGKTASDQVQVILNPAPVVPYIILYSEGTWKLA